MNKYEKELNDIKSIILPIVLPNLQELVERATPFKPTEQRDLIDDIYGKCKCGTEVRDDNSFCYRCGNKLDWSE